MPPGDRILAAEVPQAAPGLCDLPGMGLNPACVVRDRLGEAAGDVAGSAVRELADAIVAAALEVLGAIVDFLAAPVRPDVQADWYVANVDRIVAVSGVFAALFFLFGLMQAMLRSSLTDLGRVVGFTVAAFAASGIALSLAQGFIVLVDVASAEVARGTPSDITETFAALMNPLTALATGGAGQALLAALLGICVVLGALAVYLELFVRSVMIHVVTYFLPLMLVGLIWTPTRRWARRGIEFLAVLIFAKFVMYAVIALGWSAVASFDDQRLTTAWASVLTGLVLLAVAAFLPWLLFKLLPFMESYVHTALTRRDASAAAGAPVGFATSPLRTVESNLWRAASLATLVHGGGSTAAGALARLGKPELGARPQLLQIAAARDTTPARPPDGQHSPHEAAPPPRRAPEGGEPR
jgi:hypothetical protein